MICKSKQERKAQGVCSAYIFNLKPCHLLEGEIDRGSWSQITSVSSGALRRRLSVGVDALFMEHAITSKSSCLFEK